MPDNPYPTFSYLNHTISLTPSFFFHVSGPEFDNVDIYFESRRAAMQEIHRRVATDAVSELRAPQGDKHKVLNHRGENQYITRINPITGRLVGFKTDDFLFPNVPWIKTLLTDRMMLESEIASINRELEKVKIPVSRTSKHRPFDIPWLTLRLENELREKRHYAMNQEKGNF